MRAARHRRQTATYWAPDGRGFSDPVVLAPGTEDGGVRWQSRMSLVRDEGERKQALTANIVAPYLMTPGGAIAQGEHTGDPLNAEGVHELTEARESLTLRGNRSLYQATARPFAGRLPDHVTVYAVDRVEDGRGYRTQRGEVLHDGEATVSMPGEPARAEYAGQNAAQWDTLVTIPMVPGVRDGARVEVVWNGITLDGIGPVYGSDWSPFWVGVACVQRRAQT